MSANRGPNSARNDASSREAPISRISRDRSHGVGRHRSSTAARVTWRSRRLSSQNPLAEVAGTKTPRIGFQEHERPLHGRRVTTAERGRGLFGLRRIHRPECLAGRACGALPLHPSLEPRVDRGPGGGRALLRGCKVVFRLNTPALTFVKDRPRRCGGVVQGARLLESPRALEEHLVVGGPPRGGSPGIIHMLSLERRAGRGGVGLLVLLRSWDKVVRHGGLG